MRVSSERLRPLQAGDPRRVGKYRLLARLGVGGMGRVYLGRSQGGRTVAVKMVHPHLAEDRRFRRRFAQEVAAARRVGGFHTAQVVDADTDADTPWLVTEYIAGPSLEEAVDEYGALPERSVAALGAGLAEGLMAVHERNVVHRDLKPGNVLLAQDGPRIIDFGIARALDASSQTTRTTVAGTPGFMSPEQFRGREVGPAGDVFCLAAVLAFAATGRGPFGEGPIEALGYRVVNEDPDLTGVPASLFPLVAAGLEKDPDDRPGLGEFLDRCSALADGGEPPLPPRVTTMIVTRVAETEALTAAMKPPGSESGGSKGAGFKGGGSKDSGSQGAGSKAAGSKGAGTKGAKAKAAGNGSGQKSPPPRGTPRGTPHAPPPPPRTPAPKPPVSASTAGPVAVAGVLLVAAFVWLVSNDREEPVSPGAAGTRTTATSTSTPTRTSGMGGGSVPSRRTPTPDPTLEAFEEISAGDCLDAYKDPYDSTEWSENMPGAVDCDRTDAYVRVTRVADSLGDCDSEPLDGESSWSHRGNGESIYLCVERRLRVGECFLGKKSENKGRISITSHGLMTSWGCGKSTVPKAFDYILQVTGLTSGDCPSGSRTWDFRGGNLCARVT
ncbi:protein kinase domain-containing protein [Actinomadura viridis]|uniref:Serine/threonine protein kinase n=1 Tax=Actinomadura viridis TaxID=58110 RepID=A0A931DTG9_9ACTN|nr:protein kinase [Actinomadura viridis]MBG6093616.1 serine/threonine protein kinase [Actinomadura viridis]